LKKFKFLLSALLLIVILVSIVIPIQASGYDVKFEVVSTSPIGATIRATINSSPQFVQMVVLNLKDIQNGIKPEDARQQEIKYLEVNQITVQDKEVKTGIMGQRDITINDVISKASEPTDIESSISKYSKATIDYLTSVKVEKTFKDKDGKDVLNSDVVGKSKLISTFNKAPKEVKPEVDKLLIELPEKITDIVDYDIKTIEEEVKTELVKNKSPTKNQGFIVDKSMTLEATVSSGSFYDVNKGWGSTGVLALIIDGQYYYDMSNSSWWSTAYAHRMSFTIDKTNVSADLTDFPVKLWLSTSSGITTADVSAIFDELGANNFKIAVTNSDNTAQCYVEIVSWDSIGETAELYVKVPAVDDSTGSDTVIYFYYDSTQPDNTSYVGVTTSTPAKAVWDSNFAAVYHMNDGADNAHIYDSTSNANHGAKKGANNPQMVDGLKGKAQSFDGVDDFIYASLPTAGWVSVSTEVSCKSDQATGQGLVFSGTDAYIMHFRGSGFYVKASDSTTSGYLAWQTPPPSGQDLLLGGTWDNSVMMLYQDGTDQANTRSFIKPGLWGTGGSLNIGRYFNTTQVYFDGLIDEVRISSIARSAPWIKFTNYSERDTAGSWGTETTITVPSVTTNVASGIDITVATLNGDVTSANNGDLTAWGFQWGTSTGVYPYSWSEATIVTGAYTHAITDVLNGIVYFRAFATNQSGTGYGAELNFAWIPLSPTNFLATISGNNIILTWALGVGADDTIIIRGDGNYPTSITDGLEVYNGALETFTDINMASETDTHYYSAWSSNAIGDSVTYVTTLNGGTAMILIFLGIILLGLTWFAVSKIPVLGIVVFGLCVGVSQYLHSNPLPSMTLGGSLDTIITVGLWGWGILVALYCSSKVFSSDGRSLMQRAFSRNDNQKVYNYNGDNRNYKPDNSTMEGRNAIYRTSIHSKLNQPKRKR